MTSRLLVCAALAALVACEGNTTQITPDAGELSARCVSSNNQAAIDQGLGFACGRGRWCDRVDGICKAGECGYDEDCEGAPATRRTTSAARPVTLAEGSVANARSTLSVRRSAFAGAETV